MRILLAASALSLIIAAPANAQTHNRTLPETDIVFVAPSMQVEGYDAYDFAADPFDTDDLEGEAVYSSITNERIGDVNEIYAGASGAPDIIEMSIGGFIGIGDKDIAVPFDQVSLYRGDDWRVYIEATEEQLETYPEFDD